MPAAFAANGSTPRTVRRATAATFAAAPARRERWNKASLVAVLPVLLSLNVQRSFKTKLLNTLASTDAALE
jgi:hypothetical protein